MPLFTAFKLQTRDTPENIEALSLFQNKNIAEGTRGPFYTIGRLSLPTAETLRRRSRRKKHDS